MYKWRKKMPLLFLHNNNTFWNSNDFAELDYFPCSLPMSPSFRHHVRCLTSNFYYFFYIFSWFLLYLQRKVQQDCSASRRMHLKEIIFFFEKFKVIWSSTSKDVSQHQSKWVFSKCLCDVENKCSELIQKKIQCKVW